MLGYSDLLEIRDPREDQTQAIAAIQKAGAHLLSLVNDVLDIARIESGREMLAMDSVVLADVVDECIRLITPAAMERRIHLGVDLADAVRDHVVADRQRLTQALLNLLSNAVKYSGDDARVDVIGARAGEQRIRLLGRGNAAPVEGLRCPVAETPARHRREAVSVRPEARCREAWPRPQADRARGRSRDRTDRAGGSESLR